MYYYLVMGRLLWKFREVLEGISEIWHVMNFWDEANGIIITEGDIFY